MRLKISHMTEYSYEEPVEFALQRLRLTPRDCPGQKVLQWQSLVNGASREASYDDHFGNRVELVSVSGGEKTIRIMASGEVETEERNGIFGSHLGYVPLWLFRRDTVRTKAGKLVKELAKSVGGDGELAKMHSLMGAIHANVAYRKDATTTETTAEQSLERKLGVCQDHAHIFISAARILGLPARYISGYMLDDREIGAASHAWAEAHVPGLGWIGFDCTNDMCPDERYVRVAAGLDYADTAPVSGMRVGTAPEMIIVSVSVEQEQ